MIIKTVTLRIDPDILRNALEDCAEVYRMRAGAWAYGAYANICECLAELDKSEKRENGPGVGE